MNPRRSFLARVGAVAAVFGLGARAPQAQGSSSFQPAREKLDDWMEQLPGKHRMFFDAVSPTGTEDGVRFANNFFTANKNGYGLEDKDLAIILGLRHNAIAFAFNDAMWAKYGVFMAENAKFTDSKTGKAPATNLRGPAYQAFAKRGVHLAICDLSAHRMARVLAEKTNQKADDVYKELAANAVTPAVAHFVPAGIVAVNRSQERGYAIAYVG